MKTRSLLVWFPGYPFSPDMLLPCRTLAEIAGCLRAAGHHTHIRDYATLDSLDRLFPSGQRDAARSLAEEALSFPPRDPFMTLRSAWQVLRAGHAFRIRRAQVCRDVAAELAHEADRGLDFIGYYLSTADDAEAAIAIAAQARDRSTPGRSRARSIAIGPFAGLFADMLLQATDVFECILANSNPFTVAEWADHLRFRPKWAAIPNLAYRANGRIRHTPIEPMVPRHVPVAAYETDIYPALRNGAKFKIFELEDSQGGQCTDFSRPPSAPGNGLRTKPVRTLSREIRRLRALHGARAFHLVGSESRPAHLLAIATGILRDGLDIHYTCRHRVCEILPSVLHALRASGCDAISFPVDTGSQRLLDNFYGRQVEVTQIEQVLRHSKAAGLFTIARLTYPCPADDRHTLEETLRLLDRTRPDAAPPRFPELVPHSPWHDSAAAFGFITPRSPKAWLVRRPPFPLPPDRWRVPPVRAASMSPGQSIQANEALRAVIEQRGIPTMGSETLALVACVLGHGERHAEFSAQVLRSFCTGDAPEIASLIEQFNETSGAAVAATPFHPDNPDRAVVGD